MSGQIAVGGFTERRSDALSAQRGRGESVRRMRAERLRAEAERELADLRVALEQARREALTAREQARRYAEVWRASAERRDAIARATQRLVDATAGRKGHGYAPKVFAARLRALAALTGADPFDVSGRTAAQKAEHKRLEAAAGLGRGLSAAA
jgi:hypothetical protein